jgi:glutamine---fructose-6-phosphate transaminase (isomerizing)|uniref:SIS domain-containing protein n=1 Tax=Candidatus Limnocylindrus sp. TaxID=2802978 RepID=UPI00404B6F78
MSSGTGNGAIMRSEIAESVQVASRLIANRAHYEAIGAQLAERRPSVVVVAGRGTSDHAAIYARYLLEHALGVPVALAAASLLTQYGVESASPNSALLAFSQSGAGPDMIALVESARRRGAYTVALTNDMTSPLAAAAESTVNLDAGPERAVAATKTYIAELVSVALIAAAAARHAGRDASWSNEIDALPERMQAALSAAKTWLANGADAPIYAALLQSSRALVVGRGFEYPNALELALKLRETTGMFSDGYSSADLLHGPIASAHAEVPAIVLSTDSLTEVGLTGSIDRLRGVGAPLLVIHAGGAGSRGLGPGEELALPTGASGPLCTPVTAIAGLAIIEAVATARGLNPDTPAGLTKVTKTL